MKLLQTLGRKGKKEGIFLYRRDDTGVIIDLSVGNVDQDDPVRITTSEWNQIICKIKDETAESPQSRKMTDLYKIILEASKEHSIGIKTKWCASIIAILEHEGTIDLCHGKNIPIVLKLDSYLQEEPEEEE